MAEKAAENIALKEDGPKEQSDNLALWPKPKADDPKIDDGKNLASPEQEQVVSVGAPPAGGKGVRSVVISGEVAKQLASSLHSMIEGAADPIHRVYIFSDGYYAEIRMVTGWFFSPEDDPWDDDVGEVFPDYP